jgi:hypothetical protein
VAAGEAPERPEGALRPGDAPELDVVIVAAVEAKGALHAVDRERGLGIPCPLIEGSPILGAIVRRAHPEPARE